MKKLHVRLLIFLNVALLAAIGVVMSTSFKGEGEQEPQNEPEKVGQTVRSFDLNRPFDFCGEPLPMDNPDVMERLDRELLRNVYYHSSTILALKRANAYFPTIEKILKEEGAPDDLKYLAVAESGLYNAVSSAGAKGFWQFMSATGRSYGLEITDEVDERYDLEKATRAACAFLKKLKQGQGSWILAAAAYNGGPDRISKEKANQRANDFFDMNLAAEETMQYLFRIVALKEIMQHPERYEYHVAPEHNYSPLPDATKVEVTESIGNLGDFAQKYGMSYRELKIYNPWLRSNSLSVAKGKSYTILIKK